MSQFWIAAGAVIAVVAVTAPLAAIVLVSIASRSEESALSLSSRAPGPITAAARRLLAYRSDHVASRPRRRDARARVANAARGHGRRGLTSPAEPSWIVGNASQTLGAPTPIGEPDLEVRFGYARRSVPVASQFPASRQPQPSSVRGYQRETAGV